jgi:hypothetical protein
MFTARRKEISAAFGRTASQRDSACRARVETGTMRCCEPLPVTSAAARRAAPRRAAAPPVRSRAARAVEQLEQREQPQRRGPVALRLELGAREQRLDLAVREDLRQRAARRRARQRRRGIVVAQLLVEQEAVELAQRRALRATVDGARPAQPCPSRPSAARSAVARSPTSARRPRDRGDRRPGCSPRPRARRRAWRGRRLSPRRWPHPRATASAAIIRASALRPTRSSARTM